MSQNKNFYITTTLPYVNSKPHVGFAMEITRADVIARYKRSLGYNVFFNTGTDEHGLKIYQKAKEEGKETQEFLDEKVVHFKNLCQKLNISHNNFIRTTDKNHIKSAQKFWEICDKNGYIYKKNYRGLYCVGCEMFLTEKDLVGGKCPHHPDKDPIEIEEENYFFKYSAFAEKLLKIYSEKENFVVPDARLKEIKNFVQNGLEDFSISRIKEKMPWGIPVPNDENHVMYVWFDALVNYVSTLGWPDDYDSFNGVLAGGNFEQFWTNGTPTQYCGKDNLHFQSARWQAMLLACGLPCSHQIIINGFITSGGQKMSKSLGNVIDPVEIIDEYGTDSLRYYLIRELNAFEDSDFTIEKFKESYNANLANGVGNVVSRILKMAEDNFDLTPSEVIDFFSQIEKSPKDFLEKLPKDYVLHLEKFDLQKSADVIWNMIGLIDKQIQLERPFSVVKEDKIKGQELIKNYIIGLCHISQMLLPIMPETSSKIKSAILENKKPTTPLFSRK
ncbi:MAG TPA: methionine--tRNA ligase [Candidatus Paceibacterota bacterium]|nr:methionine--tRNA ligase [Candidatus Paceibacterota bacterium]